VTTVRDMGNDNAVLAEALGRLDRHDSIGRTCFQPASSKAKPIQRERRAYLSTASMPRSKRWIPMRSGATRRFKIYNSFKPEWVKETPRMRTGAGLRVSGHIPAFMKAEDAVKDGLR